ncbi:MAG: group 1 glycosyl transferase, partial [Gammaproteobacteria bacterium]|nr:group 1 glycosyl transferase [Gammaproteobacteria bacterium]
MNRMERLNVLFLTQGEATPSTRVRVLDLLPALARRGIHADVLPFPGGVLRRLRVLARCRRYRVVCIQKKLPSRLFLALLRGFSRRLLLDFDDAIYRHHSSDPDSRSRTREIRFRRLLGRCDLVVAGNRILAGTARGLAATPVAIVPSAVETRGIPVKDGWNARPVVGWVGGANNLPFLRLWERPLARLARRRPFVLRILSSETLAMEGLEVEFVPWSLERQAEEIARFDVGLMPLPD